MMRTQRKYALKNGVFEGLRAVFGKKRRKEITGKSLCVCAGVTVRVCSAVNESEGSPDAFPRSSKLIVR